MRDDGDKFWHMKFRLDIRKTFSLQERCNMSILGDFQEFFQNPD